MKTFRKKILGSINLRTTIILLIVVNSILGIFFSFPIREHLLTKVSHIFTNEIDRKYYLDIFSNINIASFIIAGFLAIFLFLFKQIATFITQLSEKKILLLVLFINLLLQIIILSTVQTELISDSKYYFEIAKRFYETGVYTNGIGNFQSNYWPVGLPLLLILMKILFGNYIFPTNILIIIISELTIIILYELFRKELNKKSLAIFLFAYALFPNNLFSVNVIMTEYFFLFLVWASILFLLKNQKRKNLLYVGILLGVAAYFRSTALIFPFLFALYLIKKFKVREGMLRFIIIFLLQLLVLLPWGYRNYKILGSISFISSNGGFIFLMGNNPNANGKNNFSEYYDFNNHDEIKEERAAYSKGFSFILKNPIDFLLLIPRKLYFSYYRGDSSITWAFKKTKNKINPIIKSSFFLLTNLFYYLILIIFILSTIKNYKYLSQAYKTLFSLLYLAILLQIIFYLGSERYIIILYPIHFFFFAKFFEEKQLDTSQILLK